MSATALPFIVNGGGQNHLINRMVAIQPITLPDYIEKAMSASGHIHLLFIR